jgi:hypothetical protein
VKLIGRYRGFDCEAVVVTDIRQFAASCLYLEAQGFEPAPRPAEDESPSVNPIRRDGPR